jgi:hypothetical protein
MSADIASVYVQQLLEEGQFAVFQLPLRDAFAQVIRISSGGIRLEISRREGALETLLGRLGTVSRGELGFLTVSTGAGSDTTCGQVLAQALAVLAASAGCENVCRVRTGKT